MAGTKLGGQRARDTNLVNNPNFYKDIGRLGGKAGKTGGFYHSAANGYDWHIKAGIKGGAISSRKGIKTGQGKNYRKPPVKQTKPKFNLWNFLRGKK